MAKQKRTKRRTPGRQQRATQADGSHAAGTARRGLAWMFVRVWPAVVALACIALWFATKSGQAIAIGIAVGLLPWLAVALGSLGAQVQPREDGRAGAIDFGKRS